MLQPQRSMEFILLARLARHYQHGRAVGNAVPVGVLLFAFQGGGETLLNELFRLTEQEEYWPL